MAPFTPLTLAGLRPSEYGGEYSNEGGDPESEVIKEPTPGEVLKVRKGYSDSTSPRACLPPSAHPLPRACKDVYKRILLWIM